MFLKNIYEDGDALEKAESLRKEMSGLSKSINIPVSLSIGIAVYQRDGKSFEALYKAADEALYHVKRNGKNNISFFTVSVQPEEAVAPENREMDELDETDEI